MYISTLVLERNQTMTQNFDSTKFRLLSNIIIYDKLMGTEYKQNG